MLIHEVEQGSEEWKELRAQFYSASDAPAMMGASKYKSRNQLLQEKKTGNISAPSRAQQELFGRGHAAEAAARGVVELQFLDQFLPLVGSIEIDGLNLMASFDGLSPAGLVLEHKLFNKTLAENVEQGALEPHYYWQLEQQLLVAGATKALFVCSDGTEDNWEDMYYQSEPQRREDLIAGWKRFNEDLKTFEPEAKVEVVVGTDAEPFPMIQYDVSGSMITSNLEDILPLIKERAELEMSRKLETDQDFADKEVFNKATRETRKKLKDVVNEVKGNFVSFSDFERAADQIDSILQKMQSQGEKQVKQDKEAKKQAIAKAGGEQIDDYIREQNNKIKPLNVVQIMGVFTADFHTAMKNKRTLESIANAVDSEVVRVKTEIDRVMSVVTPNQTFYMNHGEYGFLFNDLSNIINQSVESFQAVVTSRISDFKEAEEKRIQEEEKKAAEKKEAAALEPQQQPESIPEQQTEIPLESPSKEPTRLSTKIAPASFEEDVRKWGQRNKINASAMDELFDLINYHRNNRAV